MLWGWPSGRAQKITKESSKQLLDSISQSPGNRVQSCLWLHRIRELDFRAIGWLYLGAALDFLRYFLSSFWWLSLKKLAKYPYLPANIAGDEMSYSDFVVSVRSRSNAPNAVRGLCGVPTCARIWLSTPPWGRTPVKHVGRASLFDGT